MRGLVYGCDKQVAEWVSKRIGGFDFGACSAIGVQRGGILVAGAIYSNFIRSPEGRPISIEVSFHSIDKRWCSCDNLNALFTYPFLQLGVKRFQASCAKRDKSTRRFLERVGFRLEGIGREAWPLGGDLAMYSMLRKECRWIYGRTKPNRTGTDPAADWRKSATGISARVAS